MKLAIGGTQGINISPEMLQQIIQTCNISPIDEIILGGYPDSIDTSAEVWAKRNNIPLRIFYADWNTHGEAADVLRNREIAESSNVGLIFWDGSNKGIKNLKDNLHRRKKPVHVVQCEFIYSKNKTTLMLKIDDKIFEIEK